MNHNLSPVVRLVMLAAMWLLWVAPFFIRRLKARQQPQVVDRRARWGILTVCASFFAAYQHGPRFWNSPVVAWRLYAAILLATSSILLVNYAVNNLGRQWRVDAALNADHALVTDGAYRVVRHPIYLSMFGMLLAALALVGTLPGAPLAVLLFAVGTEIRIHVEDGLLRQHFGETFTVWQRSTRAWIPFIR